MAAAAALGLLAASSAQAQAKPALVVAVGADPVNLDPDRISGGNDYLFFANVFEGLYGHDANGKLTPALAESSTVDETGTVYEFVLRANAKFHNGDPVTSDDVIFSWKRGAAPETRNPRASVLLANIENVERIDERRFRVKLKRRDASFLENSDQYWYIIPQRYFESVGEDAFLKKPVGTGPFSFVERRVKEFIKLKGFDAHWGRVPEVDDLTLRIVPDDQTRMAQIMTGEADIVTNVPPVLAPRFEKMPNVSIIRVPSFQNIFITIHATANPILARPEVRRALNMAVNKPALMKTAMLGYATPQELACSPGIDGCDAKVEPYRYDAAKARKMLQDAGFDFDKPLRLVGLAPGRTPQSKEIVEGIGYMLQQAGVKTQIDMLEYGAWLAMYGAKEKDKSVDLFFTTFTDYNNDPSGRLLRSVRTGGSFSWFSDPAIDAKLDAMNDFASPGRRTEYVRQLFADIHRAAPFITLWAVDSIYGTTKKVEWSPTPNVSWPVLWNVAKKS